MTDEDMRCAHKADESMGKEKGNIFFFNFARGEVSRGVHALQSVL